MPDSTDGRLLPTALPEGWKTKTLSEIASIHGGGTPSRQVPAYWDGTIPWVTPGEVSGQPTKYLTKTQDRITTAGLASSSATLLPVDSLLLTTRASLGAAVLSGVPTATNQGFQSLVFGTSANPHFFYHLVPRLGAELTRRASGTTFLEISGRELAKVEIPLPPLPEQRRIAEILDTADEAIQRTEELIAKLEEMKKGLLYDLLTRGIDENGELRDPERNPEQFKDSPLGRIPREWDIASIDTLSAAVTKGTTPTTHGVDYTDDGIPFLRVENITRDGEVSLDQVFHVDPSTHRGLLSRSRLSGGEVLISIAGTIGRVSWWREELGEANCNQAIALVRLHPQTVSPAFLSHFLSSVIGARALFGRTVQLAQANLNLGQIRKSLVPIPSQEEAQAITNGLDRLANRARRERRLLRKLSSLKQALMNDLLTGRVRVHAPKPEEATA